MKRYTLLFLVAILFVFGCQFKRENPLDPWGSGQVVSPGSISGLVVSVKDDLLGTPVVVVSFNRASNADGYYIYRSLGYYSQYVQVGDLSNDPDSPTQVFEHSSQDDVTVRPGEYWYRVAAYKRYPAGVLIGKYSKPKRAYIRIPND